MRVPQQTNTMMSHSILAALFANLSVAGAKAIGAAVTASPAMAADAIHSASDSINQGFLLYGRHRAEKRPNTDHPLGFGKEIYFWSFIVALVIFFVGGVYAIYEGIHKFYHPTTLEFFWVGMGILAFAFVAEAKALSVCLKEIREKYPNKSLKWFFKETRSPELLVLLVEDSAALLGLVITAGAMTMSYITGDGRWDAAGAIGQGILLVTVASLLMSEVKALLIGQSVEPQVRKELRELLAEYDHIAHSPYLTLQTGGDEALLAINVRYSGYDSVEEVQEAKEHLRAEIKKRFPIFTDIYIDASLEEN